MSGRIRGLITEIEAAIQSAGRTVDGAIPKVIIEGTPALTEIGREIARLVWRPMTEVPTDGTPVIVHDGRVSWRTSFWRPWVADNLRGWMPWPTPERAAPMCTCAHDLDVHQKRGDGLGYGCMVCACERFEQDLKTVQIQFVADPPARGEVSTSSLRDDVQRVMWTWQQAERDARREAGEASDTAAIKLEQIADSSSDHAAVLEAVLAQPRDSNAAIRWAVVATVKDWPSTVNTGRLIGLLNTLANRAYEIGRQAAEDEIGGAVCRPMVRDTIFETLRQRAKDGPPEPLRITIAEDYATGPASVTDDGNKGSSDGQ